MHDEHTSMDSRTFKRLPRGVLSTGRPVASVMLLITLKMDVNVFKAEGTSSLILLEDATLWESAGSSLLEGAGLWGPVGLSLLEGALFWELVGSSFLRFMNFEKNFLNFKKKFLNAFIAVSVRDLRVYWPVSDDLYDWTGRWCININIAYTRPCSV